MTTLLDQLKPTEHHRVIDLVEAAGLDVTDWANFEGGASKAATNPRYCYEWAFAQPGRAVVVNFWFDDLVASEAGVALRLNAANRTDLEGNRRVRVRRLFDAIAQAAAENLPVRVIVNTGTALGSDEGEGMSKDRVRRRLLDPIPWHVAAVDGSSLTCEIRRGPGAGTGVDQFSADEAVGAVRREVATSGFVRDPAVRQSALDRAGGRCEHCGSIGFVLRSGRVFLETHHVEPLAEGGGDVPENLIAICPNDHREVHLGLRAAEMKRLMRAHLDRVFAK